MPGFSWKESKHSRFKMEDEYGNEGKSDEQMGTESTYTASDDPREIETSRFRGYRSKGQKTSLVRGRGKGGRGEEKLANRLHKGFSKVLKLGMGSLS